MGNEKLRGCGAKSVFKSKCNTPASDHCSKFPARSTFPIQKKEPLLFFLAATTATSPAQPERAPRPPQLHKHIGRAGLHPHVCFFPPVQARVPFVKGTQKQGLSEDCDQGHLLALLKSIVMFDQNDFAQRPPAKAIPLYRI